METLVSRLVDAGFEVVRFGESADWTIVNTCTVTQEADSDSRQLLRKAVRFSPNGRVVATGCLAQRVPADLASIPGVNWVVGNGEKALLDRWIVTGMPGDSSDFDEGSVPMVEEHSGYGLDEGSERAVDEDSERILDEDSERTLGEGSERAFDDDSLHAHTQARAHPEAMEMGRIFVASDPTANTFLEPGSTRAGRRTRASLKIQDGCDEHCTFCVIPDVRGASRSRPLADVRSAAKTLAAAGFREVALTGINTALWGHDFDPPRDLLELLNTLETIPDLERVRLNSLEPQYVTAAWLAGFTRLTRLCRHLHLPLQSGDAAILKRMNRRYDREHYAAVAHEAVRLLPGVAIGADVLVGFPGESEREFRNTHDFLEALPLAYLHVFRYSPRPGTPAPRLGSSIPPDQLKARSARLRALGARKRAEFVRQRLGSVETVIPEGPSGSGVWQGLTGNYIRVRFAWPRAEGPAIRALPVRLEAMDVGGGATGSLL